MRIATMKRGTIKSFREYLNAKFADSANWKNGRHYQSKRGYGDYLYHQDREKFDVELADALAGHTEYKDWRPCHLCDKGFPVENGEHYGTQSLGMIPTTPCGRHTDIGCEGN